MAGDDVSNTVSFMKYTLICVPLLLSASVSRLAAEDVELAKKLTNPVADLISVPFQGNYDFGVGPGDGTKFTLNIQPVIPIALNDEWNVISRTILPVIDQEGIAPGLDETGLGDTTQSFFFSPKKSDPVIWGFGPVFLIPTATDDLLGTEKFGIGPTGVMLKQEGHWTYGILANHIWDVAGNDDRASVNSTFLQPFLSYTTPKATTFTLNLESAYDWQRDDWNVPVNFLVNQLVKIGGHPVSIFAGGRYYFETPEGGPEWGVRFGVTFLLPKS